MRDEAQMAVAASIKRMILNHLVFVMTAEVCTEHFGGGRM